MTAKGPSINYVTHGRRGFPTDRNDGVTRGRGGVGYIVTLQKHHFNFVLYAVEENNAQIHLSVNTGIKQNAELVVIIDFTKAAILALLAS